ncbi:hypothetical protein [Vibrio sp. CAU 1672]|uniref:hypothetical protein n=1 Tax=Vibrio sp. CAU 1672 TaxID=3032594 RepID=UPI0023DBA4D4|nr:hypothetical protein [Vibrio sp. CAU 1672]MDF2152305.1 hypothetical protein [Vibrio sp. CAU 1672]
MLAMFRTKGIIQSLAKEAPYELSKMFGEKQSYSPVEVEMVLDQLGYNKSNDPDHYIHACGMFCDSSSYTKLALEQELGDYSGYQRAIGKMLLNTPEPVSMLIYFELAQQHMQSK